jgi:O-acetyl-ADP-ribose deacetylase (regulator of RNase III)
MSFKTVKADITEMKVDAIVNAANVGLLMGGGVCGAIFRAAGASDLQAACDKLAPIKTGEAVITSGFRLPAKFIIHTAGPVYSDGKSGEEEQLRSCYLNSLRLAEENACKSIAFPLISSGIYGYPTEEALRVAAEAANDFLKSSGMEIYLALFDRVSIAAAEKMGLSTPTAVF